MPTVSRQLRLVLLTLVAVVGVLTIAYFALFSQAMVPVYQNIRQSDASSIIAELDKAGIAYRLENEGRDILVAEDQAAQARVVVAGSTVSVGGTVGFELFNDSDMGLTEFAQKINFQRAMQGELARTIMMMDGVAFARVHLALPERSIFRVSQGQPTAAVTIEMAPGSLLTQQKVDGVRQLIASSVPGLSANAVTVLDERGDLLSGSPTGAPERSPDNEAGALQAFYTARGRSAVLAIFPELAFELSVVTTPTGDGERLGVAITPVEDDLTTRGQPGRAENSLRVLVRTVEPLSAGDSEAIESALVAALDLDRAKGDALNFTTGAVGAFGGAPPMVVPAPAAGVPMPSAVPQEWKWDDGMGEVLFSRWTVGAFLLLLVIVLLLRPRRQLDAEEAASFAELLRNSACDRQERNDG